MTRLPEPGLLDRLRAHAAARPDAPALNHLTYAGLLARVEDDIATLAARGVSPGDRVAVLALNHPRTIILLFACEALGAMLVPLNWRLAGPELQWILEDAAPRLLFVDGAAAVVGRPGTTVLPIERPQHQSQSTSSTDLIRGSPASGDREGSASAPAFPLARDPRIKSVDDVLWVRKAMCEPGRIKSGHDVDGGRDRTQDEAATLLVYTSGTTGRPKGALLSTAALLANAALSEHMHALTAADHVLTVLPLFHVGGLNIQTLPALLAGARVTLHPRFEPGATLEAIRAERPTLTVLVPATLQALAADPGFAAADFSSLRAVTTGSTVVQPAVLAPFLTRGIPVLQVYGSTETAPIAIYTRLDGAYAPDSTGHPGPACRARTATGAATGEILLAGPQLFHGYWRNPAAFAEAVTEGWYRTGDIGTQAPDGTWTVHDRLKSLIVSGGENVYPAEIERVLHEMPGIAEAAVTGTPDPRWQEVPQAWVVLRPGAALDEAAIVAHVRSQLAGFKAPRRVRFVGALPRNAMGKVQHALLKDGS